MASKGINGVSIVAVLAGSTLAYSGLKGKSISTTIKSFLEGNAPKGGADAGLSILQNPSQGFTYTPGEHSGGFGGIAPPSGGSHAANKSIGAMYATTYGWGPGTANWTALDKLWTRESGWNNRIINRSSGAFGIAQFLGHGGANTAATTTVEYTDGSTAQVTVNEYPSKAANAGNAGSQIALGLQYIKATYGNPLAAWAHEEANSWY